MTVFGTMLKHLLPAQRQHVMQGDFMLTSFADGCLPAAFMVGLLVACPIFVHLSKSVQTFKLVGVGLLIWFASVFASGLTWDFWSLLFCRTAVGAGEASFVILAAPFVGVCFTSSPIPSLSPWMPNADAHSQLFSSAIVVAAVAWGHNTYWLSSGSTSCNRSDPS